MNYCEKKWEKCECVGLDIICTPIISVVNGRIGTKNEYAGDEDHATFSNHSIILLLIIQALIIEIEPPAEPEPEPELGCSSKLDVDHSKALDLDLDLHRIILPT
jgi:hypothetical protein